MTAQPHWQPVDEPTADLLTLLADDGTVSVDFEWDLFVDRLRIAARQDGGQILPNTLRPMLRDRIKPQRVGAFTNRAKAEGLIAFDGEWEVSDDTEGRNGGKPARVYRWTGGAQ